MHIKDLFARGKTIVSLEVSPPKSKTASDGAIATIEAVKEFNPAFVSVTYGAGGSSRDYTVEIADRVKNRHGLETLSHLTCVGTGRGEIDQILSRLKEKNISNILAMRGDMPQEGIPIKSDYTYAQDLIRHLKKAGDFCIAAACYPEGHLECESLTLDRQHLKEKVNSGVDFLITQLFFSNHLFYRFREELAAWGIQIPVLAGIMPVLSRGQLAHLAKLCRVSIPPRLEKIITKFENDPQSLRAAGIDFALEQILDLKASGVDGIHLFTLNRPEVAREIFAALAN